MSFIYLASQSPRRRQLLEQIGVRHELLLPRPDEDAEALEAELAGELPADYVERVTHAKLEAARARWRSGERIAAPILCADTTVALGRRILGKPRDAADAAATLRALSGSTHRVITAVALAWPLWRQLPRLAVPLHAPSYTRLLASMLQLLRQDRMLRTRGMLALLMFATFNIFWSALVLPLSAPPYSLSLTAIGAFGLAGVVGALAAARAGHWADQGFAQRTSLGALVILLLAWVPIALLEQSLWALVAGIVLLDLGGQALHVTNQSLIFRSNPQAHSRLVGLYMLFYAVGSGLGALIATNAYARFGWHGVCVAGAAFSLAALVFWAMTRETAAQASVPA